MMKMEKTKLIRTDTARQCSRCRVIKPLREFSKSQNTRETLKLQNTCKQCFQEMYHARRDKKKIDTGEEYKGRWEDSY
jgi:hypothetical protein